MFTGIVEEAGIVEKIRPGQKSIELTIRSQLCGQSLKTGDSLAVNGCCLTVVKKQGTGKKRMIRFDLLQETWRKTNLQSVKSGSLVNLERPLRADGRLDGHFVTGHIDALGKITEWRMKDKDHFLQITAPAEAMRHIIHKGSIALDGISLTVAEVKQEWFSVWIIPHTYEVTALRERKQGDTVNLETDILGKYVERFVAPRGT
jgi:riboflavin synthase